MNNITIAVTTGIAMLSMAGTALAGITCAPTDHKVFDTSTEQVVSCISDAAWQADANAAQARGAQHLPVVSSGTVLHDEAGLTFQVPNITYLPGWVDLTHTAAYRAQARLIAAQLNGTMGYGYWLTN